MIQCDGTCGDSYHHNCVGVSEDECKLISGRKGFLFLCETCRVRCDVDLKDRGSQFDKKIEKVKKDLQESLGVTIERLFADRCGSASGLESSALMTELRLLRDENGELRSQIERLSALLADNRVCLTAATTPSTPSYAEKAASNKTAGKIIIKPKDVTQSSTITKTEIMKGVDTLGTGTIVTAARTIGSGGLVLDCQNSRVFREVAVDKLSEKYDITEAKKLHPRIRVVGMSSDVDESLVIPYLVKANPTIFESESSCNVIKYSPTKKNIGVFQATIQLDVVSFKRAMAARHVLVGLDRCGVFNAIDVIRCYRCNGYNHLSSSCRESQSCPRCGEPHRVEDCKSEALKCSNCVRVGAARAPHVDHAVWEVEKCEAYKMHRGKLEREILGPEGASE